MNRNSGFTLLEVLVAITLASLLLASIYGVFTTTSTAKQQIEKQGAAYHLGRVLIARLNREILGLALTNQMGKPALQGGLNSRGEPYIELITSSSGGSLPGMRLVQYRLANDPEGLLTLWRAEKGLNDRAAAVEEGLSRGINRLVFHFFDGKGWRETWNSTANGRPLLVRAEIKLEGIGDAPPLLSVFDLPRVK